MAVSTPATVHHLYRDTFTGPTLPAYDTSVSEADISDKRVSHQDTPLLTDAQLGAVSDVLAQSRKACTRWTSDRLGPGAHDRGGRATRNAR
jgi:hypothetical protein